MSDDQIQEDREELLNLIEEEGINEFEFKNANKIFRKDPEIILKSTFTFPAAIHYASEDLQNRKKFILKVLIENGLALKFVQKK